MHLYLFAAISLQYTLVSLMGEQNQMNEQEFHAEVDKLFLGIEEWIEQSSSEMDFESQEGMLIIEFPDTTQMILSRQTTLQEVWLASPLGAYHFRLMSHQWLTAQNQSLLQVIVDVVKQKANITLDHKQFQQ
jgi:CyaY protein